jgi:L-alanine-DL-glutamate epimerase-like enolase superfamily enzyme
MRIVAVTERTIEISSNVRSANMSLGSMTASAIAVHTDVTKNGRPLVGLAFDSIGRYGHGGLLRERFIPRLTAADPERYADGNGGVDPHGVWNVVMENEKPAGHGERCGAVGLIDAAVWDLAAKLSGEPLWRMLARTSGQAAATARIAIYASGGHYRADNDIALLCEDVRSAIGFGHRRFKIKIGGAELADDLRRVDAVLAILEPGMTLAVDGNGNFDRSTALCYLEALAPYPLAWIEEPVHPLDFDLYGEVAALSRLPLATGENIFSHDDARNLLRYAGLRNDRDVLQIDISLSYGIVEYLRILDLLGEHDWARDRCAPHAGHLLAAHCVAGLGLGLAEVAMDGTTLFGQLTSEIPVDSGVGLLSDAPGAGFEALSMFPRVFREVLH